MDRHKLKSLIESVARQELSSEDALNQLKDFPYHDLGYARLDSHRAFRQGIPEVIFCPGKTPRQVIEIACELKAHHNLVAATKVSDEMADLVLKELSDAVYYKTARLIIWGEMPPVKTNLPAVAVITAGTADIPVAEEAALFLLSSAINVKRLYDVGVAGIHRLIDNLDELRQCPITIVVAGMDGVLPSVVGGLLAGPVIAVPTSVGYGTSFGGVTALLTMLNSCAAGVTVLNIDNGFGAAVAALRMLAMIEQTVPLNKVESSVENNRQT